MMLFLPLSRSTPALIGFGLLSAALGLLVCLLAYALLVDSPLWIAAALIWVAGLGVGLVCNPLWFQAPYARYNHVVRRWMIPLLRNWILAVTFGLVLAINRPFSRRLRAAGGSGTTTWHAKTIENLLGGSGQQDVAIDETRNARWLPALFQWIRQTQNWWVIALVPFMLMLRTLDEGEAKSAVSADTYTLY